jgi:hypothetical protein
MNGMTSCLYFAFGSNMLRERLCVEDRCPSAKPLGPAYAVGYRVTMWKQSSRDGSGKATLVKADGHTTHGVLYELGWEELALLDESEGVGRGYEREAALPVAWQAREVTAHAYIAPSPHIDKTLLPFDWYSALCIAGARQHGLPAHYIEVLQAMPTQPDPIADREHRQRALQLLHAAGFSDIVAQIAVAEDLVSAGDDVDG